MGLDNGEFTMTVILFNWELTDKEIDEHYRKNPIPDDGEWHTVTNLGNELLIDGVTVWKYDNLT